MSDNFPDEDRELVLVEIIEGLIAGHHRLGHELLALQAVCGHLRASQCSDKPGPIAAVERAVALLSGTGVAIADAAQKRRPAARFDTRGTTDTLERVAAISEQNVWMMCVSAIVMPRN